MLFISLNAASVYSSTTAAYNDIYALSIGPISENLKTEIMLFLMRLGQNDIGFTAWDLLTITPNILTTLLTAILTYLLAFK
ncbi:hypothetical protein B4U79_08216 [Dinothrombium tinctorium]|uniref:Uncharacterized protein n=1 Tax=Dinothrombium tinctorium TaxID=1965070 RepID=A0A3S3S9B8_9ACAR|nr:hypothetical protein B4U79_08216 [Dinothrombium tinctorium]